MMAYDVLWLGIDVPFVQLEKRIRARLRARLAAGMVAEAKRLHARGLSYKRMEELGLEYRYLARHLRGESNKQQLEEGLYRAIRNYAKRQLRWLKRNPDIVWINSKQKALTLAKAFISG